MDFHSIINDHHLPALLLVEYGLVEGITYYGRLKSEHYHLPPREPGGKPERRGKTVLLISDRPFPTTASLLPCTRDGAIDRDKARRFRKEVREEAIPPMKGLTF